MGEPDDILSSKEKFMEFMRLTPIPELTADERWAEAREQNARTFGYILRGIRARHDNADATD